MKLIIFLLFFLSFASPVAASADCDALAKNSIALHGLRLNQTPEQTQNALGKNLKIKIKKRGWRVFFQNFIEKSAPASLVGVRALYLRFFDRQLYQIEIFYEESEKWKTLENFTVDLAAKMNFPASAWQTKNNKAQINCNEFSLVADKVLNPRIEITDEQIRAKVEEQRKD